MRPLFALVDCNNFYASCERIFNPALRHKPVVVLSNNDGCVIARSNEAKAAGIAMGEPYFKCQDKIKAHDIRVYSANFVLYGNMSERVMNTLATFTPQLEIYSIDEAFLSLEGLTDDHYAYVKCLKEQVKRDTGMPVSVGVASTKTLAKLANRIAKKLSIEGVCCLIQETDIDHWLQKTAVADIWGIGHQKAEFLKRHGIDNAYQLKNMPDAWIKKHLTVISLKTVWELRGLSCFSLEEVLPDKKAIGTSRTFGREVSTKEELMQAVAAYTAKAAEKMRQQHTVCGYVQVFLETDRFKVGQFYFNSAGIDLTPPTAYTPTLIASAEQLVSRIYRQGYRYKKAGVLLTDLQHEMVVQEFLFDEKYQDSPKHRLMKVIDQYNRQTNHGHIFVAAQGIEQPWFMKQSHKSKRYTTRWDELLEIKI